MYFYNSIFKNSLPSRSRSITWCKQFLQNFPLNHAELAEFVTHIFGDDFDGEHARLSLHSSYVDKKSFTGRVLLEVWQSHFVGMFEFTTEEPIFPPRFLFIPYDDYLANGILQLVSFAFLICKFPPCVPIMIFSRPLSYFLCMHNAPFLPFENFDFLLP